MKNQRDARIFTGVLLIAIAAMYGSNADAATFELTPASIVGPNSSIGFSNKPENLPDNSFRTFRDHYLFEITNEVSFASSITTIGLDGNGFRGLQATLESIVTGSIIESFDVSRGALGDWTLVMERTPLPASKYQINVSGQNMFGSAYGGNMTLAPVEAVPVPAAVWLFGSALAGLIGVGRRKKNNRCNSCT